MAFLAVLIENFSWEKQPVIDLFVVELQISDKTINRTHGKFHVSCQESLKGERPYANTQTNNAYLDKRKQSKTVIAFVSRPQKGGRNFSLEEHIVVHSVNSKLLDGSWTDSFCLQTRILSDPEALQKKNSREF